MNGWLLDTSVLSAFAPGRREITTATAAWFEAHSADLHLSAVTVAEIEEGIAKLHRKGAAARARLMRLWFDSIVAAYADRILPFDARAARHAGAIADAAVGIGRHPGFPDIAIAATAQARGLEVLTCNLRHFGPLGVNAADPFDSAFTIR